LGKGSIVARARLSIGGFGKLCCFVARARAIMLRVFGRFA